MYIWILSSNKSLNLCNINYLIIVNNYFKPFPSNGILVTYDKRDNVTDEVSLLNNDDCFPPFFSSIKGFFFKFFLNTNFF